jgi:hypothetical protein
VVDLGLCKNKKNCNILILLYDIILIMPYGIGGALPDWNIDNSANRFNQSYVKDFIDISGSLLLRSNANLYVKGNTTINGNLLLNNTKLQRDLSFNKRIFVGSDISMNGNVNITNDISLNGVVLGCSFNGNSIPTNAFSGTVTAAGPDYTKTSTIYQQDFRADGDVSMNGSTIEATNIKVNGNIVFNDGTKMNTYDNNIGIFYDLSCNDISYSAIPTTYNVTNDQGILCSEDGKYILSIYGTTLQSGGPNIYYNTSNSGKSGLFLSNNYGISYELVSLPTVATDPSGVNAPNLTANNLTNVSYTFAAISPTGKYMMCCTTGTNQAPNAWYNSVIAFSSDYGVTWSSQFTWRFLKQHNLVNANAFVLALAVNRDASVIAVSMLDGTYISTDYMNSFSVRNSMPKTDQFGRLDILGNNRILIPYVQNNTGGIRIYDLSGNSKYSNLTLIPSHPFIIYSASTSGNVIAVANSWNPNNTTPPYCYLITTDDGTTYTTTNLTPSGVSSTALPDIYNGTTVTTGFTVLTCMVSSSGKYVMFGASTGYGQYFTGLDLRTYSMYYSDNYGKDASGNYIFTKIAPPFSRGPAAYKSTSISENGYILMQYPEVGNSDTTSSRRIIRLDFRKFKASTFTRLTIKNTLTAGSYVESSDYRIKTDVAKLDKTFTVDNLRPVKYLHTLLNKQQYGLIAHELQQYYPDLVIGEKDGKDLQRVNYNGIIAILINEINQMKQQLTELENKCRFVR